MDYDPETLRLLYGVFAAMWADVDTSIMPLTEQGALRVRMKQHLMDLYFTEGADLSNREVLVAAAAAIGLDAAETREA